MTDEINSDSVTVAVEVTCYLLSVTGDSDIDSGSVTVAAECCLLIVECNR